ncbi:ATP-binding protein [Longispora urticae]
MSGCLEVSERASCVVVPHHAQAAGLARRRVAVELSPRLGAETLADVTAIVSELVGNAVLHARPLPDGGVRVAWQVGPNSIELRVTDGGAIELPHVRRVGPESLNGRGLSIVAALSDRWGVIRDGLGQCVWAELRHAA